VILSERRANPGGGDVFSEDSAMMQKAKDYAVHRFMTKPEESLKASVGQHSDSTHEYAMIYPSC
jgi:hypothetical protein